MKPRKVHLYMADHLTACGYSRQLRFMTTELGDVTCKACRKRFPREPAIDKHAERVALAANVYVRRRLALEDATMNDVNIRTLEVDYAWHQLAFAVVGECRYCDPGTCPLAKGMQSSS